MGVSTFFNMYKWYKIAQWTGFYMITASVMKELTRKPWNNIKDSSLISFVLTFISRAKAK